jgi:hypothetical protein
MDNERANSHAGCRRQRDFLQGQIDELRQELAAACAAAEINFTSAKRRERENFRHGFEAGQALDEYGNRRFVFWEDYEKHLAELEEHAACEARIAEAEEKEEL